jgi:DNA processing protein
MTTLPQNVVNSSLVHLDEDRLAWLALALSPGLGPKRILDAMRQLDAPCQLFTLPLTALEGLRFPAEAAQFIFDGKARQAAEEEWARVVAQGATLVSFSCPEYPERLKEIYDPPPVLWVRGAVSLLSRPAIAVVGTQHPSPYGSGIAEMISRDLAVRQLLIVSGMARGIDSCAHRGRWRRACPRWPSGAWASMWSIPKKTRSWPKRFLPPAERL